jgi:phosphoenolpyruvate phosphomutase
MRTSRQQPVHVPGRLRGACATPEQRRRALREALAAGGLVRAVGAHDALSALLAERHGFEAIWAGGFGISASALALPDANVMTLTESVEALRRMVAATELPVVADGENGFGSVATTIRSCAAFAEAGASATVIEDSQFPRRSSLHEANVDQPLVPLAEQLRRLDAARRTLGEDGVVLVARTEALTTGAGMEEALERGRAYAAAGVDAVLVHSRDRSGEEVLAFAQAWREPTPLVAIPTAYPQVGAARLAQAGYAMVLFANQLLRAAVRAMDEALGAVAEHGSTEPIESRIAPVKEIFELVETAETMALDA